MSADEVFLLALWRARAGRMVHDLASELRVSESSIRARASRLSDAGLIETARTEGFAFYRLSDKGKRETRKIK